MTVEEFLRRVLPANTSGDYILSSQNKQQNQPWRDRKISGFDKLLDALARTDRNADVYFACGTFAGHRRGRLQQLTHCSKVARTADSSFQA